MVFPLVLLISLHTLNVFIYMIFQIVLQSLFLACSPLSFIHLHLIGHVVLWALLQWGLLAAGVLYVGLDVHCRGQGIRMVVDTFWGLFPDLVLLYHLGGITSYLYSLAYLNHWAAFPIPVNVWYSPLELNFCRGLCSCLLPRTGWCPMSASVLGSRLADPQD